MELEDNGASPEDAYYRRIDAAWEAAGSPKPEEISKLAWQDHGHELPPQTVKGWLTKKHIPRLADPRSREHFRILIKVLRDPGNLAKDWEPLVLAAGQVKTTRLARSETEPEAQPPIEQQQSSERSSLHEAEDAAGQPAAPIARLVPPPRPRPWWRIGRWRVVVLVALLVIVAGGFITTRVLLGHGQTSQGLTDSSPAPIAGGLRVVAIPVPVKSLTAQLVLRLGRHPSDTGTIIGYKFTNDADNRCLNANRRGDSAGRDGDTVHMWDCYGDPDEVWFPVQWERSRSDKTWLVNQKYQTKCLDAVTIGRETNGRPVQLWECGDGTGEQYWDFGDWYRTVNQKGNPAPLRLNAGPYGLDADASRSRNGDPVRIWKLRNSTNQLWF